MNGGSSHSGVDATLGAGGAIAGTVTAAAQPVWYQQVQVTDSSGVPIAEACTDHSGHYSVGDLASGSYYVRFTGEDCGGAQNYESQYYDDSATGTPIVADATAVGVSAGATTGGIGASLVSSGAISGTVTDSSDTPVGNVLVVVSPRGGPALVGVRAPDASGDYTVSDLAAGAYVLEFEPGGCGGADTYLDQYYDDQSVYASVPLSSAAVVTVSDGTTTSGIDATLQNSARISGQVTGSGSAPLAGCRGADSSCWRTARGARPQSRAHRRGRQLHAQRATGQQLREISLVPDGAACAGVHGYIDQSDVAYVTVSAGANRNGLNEQLALAGGVSGTVTDNSGGIGRVPVSLISGGVFVQTVCTEPDGSYDFTDLASGSDYQVAFAVDAFGIDCGSSVNYEPQYADTWVSVTAPNTTTGIDASLVTGGEITGTVTSGAIPLAGVEVDLYESGSEIDGTCTGQNGAYAFSNLAAANDYEVGFAPANAGCSTVNSLPEFYDGSAGGSSTLSGASDQSVSDGSNTSGIDAQLQAGGKITGRVTDAYGPAVDVAVVAYNAEDEVATTCTGANGSYSISGLQTGTYLVGFGHVLDGALRRGAAHRAVLRLRPLGDSEPKRLGDGRQRHFGNRRPAHARGGHQRPGRI